MHPEVWGVYLENRSRYLHRLGEKCLALRFRHQKSILHSSRPLTVFLLSALTIKIHPVEVALLSSLTKTLSPLKIHLGVCQHPAAHAASLIRSFVVHKNSKLRFPWRKIVFSFNYIWIKHVFKNCSFSSPNQLNSLTDEPYLYRFSPQNARLPLDAIIFRWPLSIVHCFHSRHVSSRVSSFPCPANLILSINQYVFFLKSERICFY